MFYCEPCRKKNEWPVSMSRSRGACEICGIHSICYDVHHSNLTVPLDNSEGKQ